MRILFNQLLSLVFLCSISLSSQIHKPSLSPRIQTTQHVGLAKVELDYGQPNAQGRKIFGGLIPFGKVWRTGANASTKLKIDSDVLINNTPLSKGEYALYTIPNKESWTIILSKNTQLWGSSGYDSTDDVLRVQSTVNYTQDFLETFTIHFENFNTNGGDLVIAWEHSKIVLPVYVNSDELIFAEIKDKLIDSKTKANAQTHFDAAQFYYHKKKDLELAMLWFNEAIKQKPSAFWYVYYKAELAFYLGDYKTAKTEINTCLLAAKKSPYGDFGYIGKCELMLEKLKKK